MNFPVLETERLVLSEIIGSDVESLFELFQQEEVVEYYDLDVFSESGQAEKLLTLFASRFQEKLGIRWGIRMKHTSKLIGTCGFNSWSKPMKSAVVGYDLHPDYWKKGIAQEAVRTILNAGFSGVLPCGSLYRVQADTVPGNTASERLLKTLGFQEEGLRRASGYWKGQFHDLKCFGLLVNDMVSD